MLNRQHNKNNKLVNKSLRWKSKKESFYLQFFSWVPLADEHTVGVILLGTDIPQRENKQNWVLPNSKYHGWCPFSIPKCGVQIEKKNSDSDVSE